MNLPITIAPLPVPSRSQMSLYSFKKDGDRLTEYEKFVDRFTGPDFEQPYSPYSDIRNLIFFMLTEHGAQARFFRELEDGIHYLPNLLVNSKNPSLRLFCLRCSGSAVILGNGGLLTHKDPQKSLECVEHWTLMKSLKLELLKNGIACSRLPAKTMPLKLELTLPN